MKTYFPDILKRKSIVFTLISISVIMLLTAVKSSDDLENIIFGKVENKTGFLKAKSEKTAETSLEKIFPFKNYFEEIMTNLILSKSKNLTENKKNIRLVHKNLNNQNILKFFKASETNTLNITEHTINSLLFMVQRAIPINYSVKNDTSNPLPLAIDTASLSLIIPELSSIYSKNTNMTLTVYEDSLNCGIPLINIAIDGIYFDFYIGLKMSVFNEETQVFDEILDTIISTEIKASVYTQDNKLNIFLMKVFVDDLDIKTNTLNLEKETLQTKFTGFLSLIIDQTRKMMTQIDVLKILNEFSGLDFSSFDVMTDVGSILVTIK